MLQTALFRDRVGAGQRLAELVSAELDQLKNKGINLSPVVYALPRGGIPVACPIAEKLHCPLDVIVAKKIATATNRELAIGAVTSDGDVLWANPYWLKKLSQEVLEEALEQAQKKAIAQQTLFSPFRPQVDTEGIIAIIVDDGIATGMTMGAAVAMLRKRQVAQIWICVPVAPQELIEQLSEWGDRVILLETPYPFLSVSRFYRQFPQVANEEAMAILRDYKETLEQNN